MLQRLSQLRFTPEAAIIACLALANIVLHLALPDYGYHRDELYYVAIADGFSFSNLDMPPGAPLYLKLFLTMFGHSLKVVHLAASVCVSLVIVFGCLTARELGGKRYALVLTGIFLIWSGLQTFGSLYTYDDLSFVVWAAVLYLIARMLNGADQRLWLGVGLLLGAGMLTKLTILFLGLGIFLSLWLVPERRWYRRPWIWLAAMIALLCAIPYVLWQWEHGWYFLSYASSYAGRTTHSSPVLEYLWNQLLPNNLATLPVWLIGLLMLLLRKRWAAYRFFGLCYLVLLVSLFFLGGQFYFMIPIYGVLIAAGAVRIEQWFEAGTGPGRRRLAWKTAVPTVYVLLSLPAMPYFVPVLPVELFAGYVRPLGVTAGIKTEDSRVRDLPQHMADRFGWEEMAQKVARVYHHAQAGSADTIGIAAGNWGEASALHVYGRKLGLPEPIANDGWFYFEALRRGSFRKAYVVIGNSASQLQTLFAQVERKAVFTNPWCRPEENNDVIYFCARPKVNLHSFWRVTWRMDPGFEEALGRGGIDEAATYYRRHRQQDSTALLFTESQMNRLGYTYLNRGQGIDALKAFRLNIEAFPGSFNVYDSYAEALAADRQYGLAARNYERAVELNPDNDNGRKKLLELRPLIPDNKDTTGR